MVVIRNHSIIRISDKTEFEAFLKFTGGDEPLGLPIQEMGIKCSPAIKKYWS
jgi:hypothetical protein